MPARTGDQFEILLPWHIPFMAFLSLTPPGIALTLKLNGSVSEKQTLIMGAGIGVHPFPGIKTVCIEGKPAAGMLSACTGCFHVSPSFCLDLPFVGLDLMVIPTRPVTVFYGPAPLNLDLVALLLAFLQGLLDAIAGTFEGVLGKIVQYVADPVMAAVERFVWCLENGYSLEDALGEAGDTFCETSISGLGTLAGDIAGEALGGGVWGGIVQTGLQVGGGMATGMLNEELGFEERREERAARAAGGEGEESAEGAAAADLLAHLGDTLAELEALGGSDEEIRRATHERRRPRRGGAEAGGRGAAGGGGGAAGEGAAQDAPAVPSEPGAAQWAALADLDRMDEEWLAEARAEG
jgi:hypothetical protein